MAALVGENICKSNKEIVYSINTDSTKNIVDLCNKHNKKLIFFSTCSNYGKTNEIVNENSILNPLGLYSDSKIKSEEYIIENSKNYLIARCSTLLGVSHRMRYDLTLNQFMYEIFSKGKISVYGESAWRPYIHVEDACNIVIKLLEGEFTGVYNIGDKSLNYTKKQIIDILKTKLPPFEIEYIQWDDPRDYQVDFSKLNKILTYNLNLDINKSIKELFNHFFEIDLNQDTKNNFNL
jgi:nucleoside-diphosphate-sugar epimerase